MPETPHVEATPPRSSRAVLVLVVVALVLGALGALATTRSRPAGAQAVYGGILTVLEPSSGNAVTAGGRTDSFVLDPPDGDDACAGDSATDNYRYYGFIATEDVDPTTLAFDGSGLPMPSEGTVALPLLTGAASTIPLIGQTEIDTGRLLPRPEVNLAAFAPDLLPPGRYTVGLSCVQGRTLDRYWTTGFDIAADPEDPAGWIWTAVPRVPPTPTPTPTSTPRPPTPPPTLGPRPTAGPRPTPGPDPCLQPSSPEICAAGVTTSLVDTDSAVSFPGRGRFAGMEFFVNQTADLEHQAVSIAWRGGVPTSAGPGNFAAHYVQIFQCWGEDDGEFPENPGPPPEQCAQGATTGVLGGVSSSNLPNFNATTRVISSTDWANFDPDAGVVEFDSLVWLPFRAVNGHVIPIPRTPRFNPTVPGGVYWLNPYYDVRTTNEVAAARTRSDGTGTARMELHTGVENPGLGCGQRLVPAEGGPARIPTCWLVIVPRGSAAQENFGTEFTETFGVATSPVAPEAWANRIAVPLEFKPVDPPCPPATAERRLSGSELALPAVTSWRLQLCADADYRFSPVTDTLARQQLQSPTTGSPDMAVISEPIENPRADDPVVYAPLTLSGITIGVNYERFVDFGAPADEQLLRGTGASEFNLTPRLVAKLLTQSYASQVSILGPPPASYDWVRDNPSDLAADPDFIRFNPEFEWLFASSSRTFGGLILPSMNSDAAQRVWEWILADPEASAWLDGQPDEFGMNVNPVYSTNPDLNPVGSAFGTPPPSGYPKFDPHCYEEPPFGRDDRIVPSPICGIDWLPFGRSYEETALIGRQAYPGAELVLNPFATVSADAWDAELAQLPGRRSMLVLTDTPSATRFGLQMARLSRAGDNGADREFVAPTSSSLRAGVDAMVPNSSVPAVLDTDPLTSAPGAYPLSMVAYAATAPRNLAPDVRADLAAFIDYAVGAGQAEGRRSGSLPPGYAALPSELVRVAETAADEIIDPPPAPTPTPRPTPEPGVPLELIQEAMLLQPSGALVFTQRCGVHGPFPTEPAVAGFPGFPYELRPLSATVGGTAPDIDLQDDVVQPDPLFPEYPFSGTNPSRCGVELGVADPVLDGPLTGQYFTATGLLNTATVVDLRRADPGWSVTAQVSDFVSTGASFSGNHLGWTPYLTHFDADLVADGYRQLATAGPRILPGTGLFEGRGLADGGAVLASAPSGGGNGITMLDARLRLLSPVDAPPGEYTAVITLTVI